MAERNRIRYWTRKVVPDALPRVSDGRVSVEDAMETAVNRKELEQVEDEAARMAAHQPQEQEKQETPHRRLRPAAASLSEEASSGIVFQPADRPDAGRAPRRHRGAGTGTLYSITFII